MSGIVYHSNNKCHLIYFCVASLRIRKLPKFKQNYLEKGFTDILRQLWQKKTKILLTFPQLFQQFTWRVFRKIFFEACNGFWVVQRYRCSQFRPRLKVPQCKFNVNFIQLSHVFRLPYFSPFMVQILITQGGCIKPQCFLLHQCTCIHKCRLAVTRNILTKFL